ncbi:retrovirus-related pol polyprotein from transposon TNT 1-94 [Tanacetum coccineum]|uniref:Retrovirus-related pol polyprotein from transposon TNT 1-94 n=1 Tax=Tanacetum coccineum TaxID=301880 RepID=A0ABQ5DLZ3_9ASTR
MLKLPRKEIKNLCEELLLFFCKLPSLRARARLRSDNDTELKNQVLQEYFNSVGISHQASSVRTPQQNGVMERRNRTLVEAARTTLIFSRAPLFLWDDAIATACYTQNRSIIHHRFDKTPDEHINGKKLNISFLYVFGALSCYGSLSSSKADSDGDVIGLAISLPLYLVDALDLAEDDYFDDGDIFKSVSTAVRFKTSRESSVDGTAGIVTVLSFYGHLWMVNLDNATNNVLISLDSWTVELLAYKGPLSYCYRMDDSNITMEDYIRLEEEKARKRGKVFKWETTKYGKIWYDEDIHDLRSVETKFLAIAFNDEASSKTLSSEPTVSSLNDEIDFRISFDDSDDEDYTIWLFHHVIRGTSTLDLMAEGLSARMLIEHKDARGVSLFTSRAWRRVFDIREPLFQLGGARHCLSWRQFIIALGLHTAEEMQTVGFRMDVDSVNVPYLLARHLRLFVAGRKSGALISRGQFIYEQIDDTWAWEAIGPERESDDAAGAPEAAEDAPVVVKGGQAVPAPVQASQHPPPPPPAAGRIGRMERSMTDQRRFSTWMISCMAQLIKANGQTFQAFDGIFRGSSPVAFQRRTRQRTDGASTSIAQQDQ